MKVLSVLAALALTTSSAMAVDTVMGVKGRFDYINTQTDNNPGETSSGVLTTSFLRLVTDAKINETTSAKLTLDFQAEDNAANRSDSGVSQLVDEAYLTKSLYGFNLMLGKQAVMTGGWENDYSSRDVYLTSIFNDQISDNLTGISAGYAMFGQNVYLQYLQQSSNTQSPLTDKKVVGAAYYGDFMNKMIKPVISYHKQGTSRIGAYDNLGTVGVSVNVANFKIEADYLMLEQEKASAAGDAELKSIVGHVRYTFENFQPFVKFIKEDGKKGFDPTASGAIESERTAWELGLEYSPIVGEDMRFHVVYNSSETKVTNPASSKLEEQRLYAGVAFNLNILK